MVATVRCKEPWICARNAWGRGSSKGFRLFPFPANKERRQLGNSTVNRSRWIPGAGSLMLCYVRRFLTMTDERVITRAVLRLVWPIN